MPTFFAISTIPPDYEWSAYGAGLDVGFYGLDGHTTLWLNGLTIQLPLSVPVVGVSVLLPLIAVLLWAANTIRSGRRNDRPPNSTTESN